MRTHKPFSRTTIPAVPGPIEPDPPKPGPLNRRAFLAGAAVLGASLATAGCAGTYDVASGLTGSSGGANAATLGYWNLLTGGDGTHMQEMEAYYTKTHPEVSLVDDPHLG